MKYLEIMVIGETSSGKTTICLILEEALKKAGFTVKYKDPDDPKGEHTEMQEERIKALIGDISIEMKETQLRSVPKYKVNRR